MNSMSKGQLRQIVLAARPKDSAGIESQLAKIVAELEPKTIASFQPLPSERQLQTFNMDAASKLQLVFPRISGSTLEFAAGSLRPGSLGVLEPSGESVSDIDLILVPALAVDLVGNRLGRGRGYYDRALSDFPNASKYAVVFDDEVFPTIPTDPWDEKVSGAVTPKRTIKFD